MSLASIHPLTTHRIHLGHLYVLFEYIANYLNLATRWLRRTAVSFLARGREAHWRGWCSQFSCLLIDNNPYLIILKDLTMLIEMFRVNRWADNLFDICKLEIVQKIYKTLESFRRAILWNPTWGDRHSYWDLGVLITILEVLRLSFPNCYNVEAK